jgi:hypothetical protein
MRAAQLRQVAAEQADRLRSLRTMVPVHTRVLAVYCAHCRRWRKPNRFHPFAPICRSCPGGGPVLFGEPCRIEPRRVDPRAQALGRS